MAALIGRLARPIAGLARDLVSFALPQRCPSCDRPADAARLLCEPCLTRIPRLKDPLCARCLARDREPAGCRAHPGHVVWAAWVYEERAALVIHALKYQERPQLARALGGELARALPRDYVPDVVLEVPLHRARARERGYNQAARLADALADEIGAPRLELALERVRSTPPQARLDRAARARNLEGAFRARHPRRLEGRRVLVVDDVLTTGATLEACFATLGDAGAHPTGVTLAWAD